MEYFNKDAYYVSPNVLIETSEYISNNGAKILYEMAFDQLENKDISYISKNQSVFNISDISYSSIDIIPELLYINSLKIVKHHLKKYYKIKSKSLRFYNKSVSPLHIYYLTKAGSKVFIINNMKKAEKIFDVYSYVYFLWIREAETVRYDYFKYSIFEREKKNINGNNNIGSLLNILFGKIFECYDKNINCINIYSNIILRISILLLLKRFEQWISVINECLIENEHKLDIIINNDYYLPKEYFDLEFLIILNKKNYKFYTINEV